MLLKKLSQSFKITLALMLSVLSSGILQVAPAYAAQDKQVFCNIQGESGTWKAQIGGPGTEHELPLLINDAPVFVENQNQVTASMDAACVTQYGTVSVAIAPSATEPTCETDGELIVPVTEHVSWTGGVSGDGPGTYNLTAVADTGYTLTGQSQWTVNVLPQLVGEECEEESTPTPVTPIVVSAHQTSVCTNNTEVVSPGSITVTAVEGLHYWVNGAEITGATNFEPGTYEVSFITDADYELADGLAASVSVTINPAAELECDRPDSEEVTLCHATHSAKNPFVRITVSAAGAFNGHLDDDFGGTHGNHQDGEDIIPPFVYNGTEYSQNWDAEGQAMYASEDCASPAPQPCPAPANGGVINSGSSGWTRVGDAEFVNLALSIDSNNWVDGGISYTGTYRLAEVEQLAWMLNDAGVTGAYGVGILLETESGDVIHYEPGTYTDDFWSNSPVLPANAGGQGGPYSGSLQDALDTIGNVNIVKTTFVFTSADLNENVLLTSLSFNCNTYTFAPVGGIGGGNPDKPTNPQVLGSNTTTKAPQTLGTSTELPAALPATGGESNPFLILLASLMAYGIAYLFQGRRQLNQTRA